jgi:hypothetical protein
MRFINLKKKTFVNQTPYTKQHGTLCLIAHVWTELYINPQWLFTFKFSTTVCSCSICWLVTCQVCITSYKFIISMYSSKFNANIFRFSTPLKPEQNPPPQDVPMQNFRNLILFLYYNYNELLKIVHIISYQQSDCYLYIHFAIYNWQDTYHTVHDSENGISLRMGTGCSQNM